MLSRYFLSVVLISGFLWASCKQAPDSGNGGGTTPASVGDTIPNKNSQYNYQQERLDSSGIFISGTISQGFQSFVNATGISFLGKDNVFMLIDQGPGELDTLYCAYESNGDVSIYFENPNYYQIIGNSQGITIDEPLQQILGLVFHQWITLPIASKKTGVQIYNARNSITVTTIAFNADISAVVDTLADSTFNVSGSDLLAKHCRITINAVIHFGDISDDRQLTHSRDIWFVPKIGYISKLLVKTNMLEYHIQLVPQDTMAWLKVLTSYKVY